MPKPIFLTSEYIDAMVEEFRKNIAETKMSDGKITFTKTFNYSGEGSAKVYVTFTPLAYVKMLSLLKHYDSEVAWHGTVCRKGEDTFIITDVMVYPQAVTGATVNTDQEEYQRWMMGLDDEVYNSLRMQGHSHVNMGTTPSGVDSTHQQQILSQLKDDDFYIFMIWNKSLSHTVKVYDYANNIMYEDKDIVVGVADEGFDVESFIAESDQMVKRKTCATPEIVKSLGGGTPKASEKPSEKVSSKGKELPNTKTKRAVKGSEKPEKRSPYVSPYGGYNYGHQSCGYYGGNNASEKHVDWDDEIFEKYLSGYYDT